MKLHKDIWNEQDYWFGGHGWHARVWKNHAGRMDGPGFGWSGELCVPDAGGRTVVLVEGVRFRSSAVEALVMAGGAIGLPMRGVR